MEPSPILAPVVALVAWTLVMMVWMIATRFAAMRRAGISLKGRVGTRSGSLEGVIEDSVNWKAHNYMHLVEQPTLFYAVALTLALADAGGGYNLILAWAYVGLRVVHSLFQATINIVTYRLILWVLSSFALIGLTVQAARAVCSHL
ncbi:MAPEG family protein [Allosphingosinicella sp.]|uniref:MAPEG family protein n=1 Tax=Allosphingosinicella sp. TaxID=2823234 RepID=UPI003D742EB1